MGEDTVLASICRAQPPIMGSVADAYNGSSNGLTCCPVDSIVGHDWTCSSTQECQLKLHFPAAAELKA